MMRALVLLALLALAACSTPTAPKKPDSCVRADSTWLPFRDHGGVWYVVWRTVPCDTTRAQ